MRISIKFNLDSLLNNNSVPERKLLIDFLQESFGQKFSNWFIYEAFTRQSDTFTENLSVPCFVALRDLLDISCVSTWSSSADACSCFDGNCDYCILCSLR